ncbi:MAG: hypothetical protein ACTSU5_05875 [Promethearchaeota archaeon]
MREELMNNFSNRLVLQKTIYLIQKLGFDLGYRFNWYLRGPYSPSLAADGFYIESLLEERQENLDLREDSLQSNLDENDEEALKKWDEFKDWTKNMGFKLSNDFLEFVASLAFVSSETYSRCEGNADETRKELKKRKEQLFNTYEREYEKIFNKWLSLT